LFRRRRRRSLLPPPPPLHAKKKKKLDEIFPTELLLNGMDGGGDGHTPMEIRGPRGKRERKRTEGRKKERKNGKSGRVKATTRG
jgi:hypothetical protein